VVWNPFGRVMCSSVSLPLGTILMSIYSIFGWLRISGSCAQTFLFRSVPFSCLFMPFFPCFSGSGYPFGRVMCSSVSLLFGAILMSIYGIFWLVVYLWEWYPFGRVMLKRFSSFRCHSHVHLWHILVGCVSLGVVSVRSSNAQAFFSCIFSTNIYAVWW